ncbi:MAG: 50S ribosomal protein L40e [Candidatus Hydrothermarchaeota archaeon]
MPIPQPELREIASKRLLNKKICRDCGAKNPWNAKRCRKCRGTNLRSKHKELGRGK